MLNPNEPSPYEVINESGDAPILITCDHADNRIPESLKGLSISDALRGQHIAYDIGAKQVAMMLSEKFDAPLLVANYSRLVIDLNRHPGDPGLIPQVSDGHEIPGNKGLTRAQRHQRMDALFEPYHRRHKVLVDQLESQHESPIIFSVHSFTPVMQGFVRPWHYGVLWDQCHELAEKLVIGLRRDESLCIGENQPYNAVEPRGYSMNVHAQDRGIDMGLIEIRQDLIEHETGQRIAAGIVGNALREAIGRV
ncbi:MAG: N-formylglutamate amidohydrolase [Gammaproteobacteria bacterium]|nr:N-formylglutamate amidohydrolase [Gammaproteobacteria bacterium]